MLTEAIEENFGLKPIIYKAGRYGIGPNTSEILAKLGYKIDASIVPYTSYSSNAGPDFTAFTEEPFWFGAHRPAALARRLCYEKVTEFASRNFYKQDIKG